jgi:hypothetical protein
MSTIPPIFRWLALAEAVRRELRRFRFSEPEARYLDAVVSCTISRGRLSEQVPRSLLMRMARLDKFALSRVENSLRWADVIRLTENKRRADRARSKQEDCPTIEFRLDSKSWFATSGSSGRNRKQLEEISVSDARLLHKELSELNPVQQVELPPSDLEDAIGLTVQEYERVRLTEAALAEVSGRVNDSTLADAAGAIPTAAGGREPACSPATAAGGREPACSPATAAGGREPDDPFDGDPIGFHERLRALGNGRMADWAVSNPDLAAKLGEAVAVAYKTTAPPKSPPEAVAPNATASAKANETKGLDGAVALNATPSGSFRGTFNALKDVHSSKAFKVGESEGGAGFAEAVAPNATAASKFEEHLAGWRLAAADFVVRAYRLFQSAGDMKTLANWASNETWWRCAYIVSPGAAEDALDELETALTTWTPLKAGGRAQKRYWRSGGQWINKQQATASQKERLIPMGIKFYETKFIPRKQNYENRAAK